MSLYGRVGVRDVRYAYSYVEGARAHQFRPTLYPPSPGHAQFYTFPRIFPELSNRSIFPSVSSLFRSSLSRYLFAISFLSRFATTEGIHISVISRSLFYSRAKNTEVYGPVSLYSLPMLLVFAVYPMTFSSRRRSSSFFTPDARHVYRRVFLPPSHPLLLVEVLYSPIR